MSLWIKSNSQLHFLQLWRFGSHWWIGWQRRDWSPWRRVKQHIYIDQGRSQPVFAGKPWDHFICPVASFSKIWEKKKMKKGWEQKNYKPGDHFICSIASFSEMREIGWRKVLPGVSQKLVSPGLPVLLVATRLLIFSIQIKGFQNYRGLINTIIPKPR